MTATRITILRDALRTDIGQGANGSRLITTGGFKEWIRQGTIWQHLWRYQEANIITHHLDLLPRPFMGALLLRLLSRGRCWIEDEQGQVKSLSLYAFSELLGRMAQDYRLKSRFLQRIEQEIHQLRNNLATLPSPPALSTKASPIYLRTDLCFGLTSGGSVGHIAGVLNNLDQFFPKPLFLTTDRIPTVREDLETHCILPSADGFWSLSEVPMFAFNDSFEPQGRKVIGDRIPSFIYQRYSLNNFCGVKLAQQYQVPFVLEYNGSEIWINRNWGTPLKYESLSEQIELLNLHAAQVIVVVSQPMQTELVARGIPAEKILVNPNGVDPDRYSPNISGDLVRARYSLEDKVVIGFIGTFGKWHGAEVLASAYGKLLQDFPKYRDRIRLMMIGDGVTMPEVQQNIDQYSIHDSCILTGLVPQAEGPAHLAACDILASPHVPNSDGTPFFGSPTKLFEYMAMGKGIVASDLDQIGEVLTHDQTAHLVKPGDIDALVQGLRALIEAPDRCQRLGYAARQVAIEHHTWKEHTHRIIEKLKAQCA
ncbi:glycosyltransferase family 4 protein [Acaryochloris sp. 'Moss Beach']|uniref:glycosyltransferase family 4 protein n=1 Tax=Acaryochloris sp. 'Moss Beach' TaxID=2740837 RepID=UPI001F208F73|nr:glycosyltransferase family 4 protein [Acaryochloris sp. 'Moss Beach']UJB69471.1 glycosyltransferase family 4 protein [Acaryochloris sp. 'Moss Beach']